MDFWIRLGWRIYVFTFTDYVFLAQNKDLQELIISVVIQEIKHFSLKIKVTTKYMHFTRQGCLQDKRLWIEGHNFEQVKTPGDDSNNQEPKMKSKIILTNSLVECI